jgi:hypothetical protein
MKSLTAKTGLLLTLLLVVTLLTYAFVGTQRSTSEEDCTISEQSFSGAKQANLNLKGVTRHLLDFYK